MEIRVLLVRAPSVGIAFNSQHLGFGYIAAVLEKEKIPVAVIDAPVLDLKQGQVISEAKKFKPSIIGFTSVTQEYPYVLKSARNFKKHFRECPIIIGGSHVNCDLRATIKQKCFDIAVLGEGEETMVELVHALEKGASLRKIKGLVYKQGGKIIINPPRPPIENLDQLPLPARHLFPPLTKYRSTPGSHKNLPIGSIITSRGCPFHCTFCDHAIFGENLRLRDYKKVVDEIEVLVKDYGAREIRVWDDTFNFDAKRVINICKEIIKRKLVFSWTCQGRVNFVDLTTLRWMKKAGCWQISYGIESGNQQQLNRIKKGITLEMVRQAVAKTKKAGIEMKGFFMLGLPGDTEKTMQETIDFAKELDVDIAAFSITIPFLGTEIYRQAIKDGELKPVSYNNYTPYDLNKLSFVTKGLTEKIIFDYQKKAYREFYSRPKIFLRELGKIRSLTQLSAKIKGFLSIQT